MSKENEIKTEITEEELEQVSGGKAPGPGNDKPTFFLYDCPNCKKHAYFNKKEYTQPIWAYHKGCTNIYLYEVDYVVPDALNKIDMSELVILKGKKADQ